MWAGIWIDPRSPCLPWKPASHVLTTWSPNFMKNTKPPFSIPSILWNPIFHSQHSSGIVFVRSPLAHQTGNSVCGVLSLALPTSLKFLLQLILTCSLSAGCPDTSQTLHLSPCVLAFFLLSLGNNIHSHKSKYHYLCQFSQPWCA